MITKNFRGMDFYFNETPMSQALIDEIFSDNYKVLEAKISFPPGDVILDVGACEGMFSIFMAKLFPSTRIISFEPVPRTFYQMIRNIALNGVSNIEPHNIGIGKERGQITMSVGKDFHSGGSSGVMTFNPDNHIRQEVKIISLDDVWEDFKLDRVRFLKIDIEGIEYDALYNCSKLDKVDYLSGEFHINSKLEYEGRRIDGLANWVSTKTNLVFVEPCRMAE